MKIKGKIELGVIALFAFLVVIAGLGLFSIFRLESDTKNILKNNYESVMYMNRVLSLLNGEAGSTATIAEMDSIIRLQENNITEIGEAGRTANLRVAFRKFSEQPLDSVARTALLENAVAIQRLNMLAVETKTQSTIASAEKSYKYLTILATMLVVIALVIIFNLPGYIANPIVQLTAAIKSIARKNYEERLYFSRKDEFRELAEAFNQMAEKLDEYEHSNLANILFEKKRIETIINQMNDPVLGLDSGNFVVFANQEALQLLNLQAEQLIDRYAPDVAVENDLLRTLIRQDADDLKSPLKIVVAGKEHFYTKEAANIEYTPTGENEKQQIGRVILLRDITTFKEIDQAKTNFIATISHELKTPIASIQMGSALLNDGRLGTLNTEQQKIAASLQEESARLSRLVSELLDLSQAESGRMKLHRRSESISRLVERAVQSVTMQAQRKHVSIRQELHDDLPEVNVDGEKTTWVLTNLLTNAIRHSPENGAIEVKAFAVNGRVQIDVIDHGSGIEARYLGRVFDRFFQIPGAVTGTGLGLTICKEIVENQSGMISVASELGRGTTFSVLFPVYQPPS